MTTVTLSTSDIDAQHNWEKLQAAIDQAIILDGFVSIGAGKYPIKPKDGYTLTIGDFSPRSGRGHEHWLCGQRKLTIQCSDSDKAILNFIGPVTGGALDITPGIKIALQNLTITNSETADFARNNCIYIQAIRSPMAEIDIHGNMITSDWRIQKDDTEFLIKIEGNSGLVFMSHVRDLLLDSTRKLRMRVGIQGGHFSGEDIVVKEIRPVFFGKQKYLHVVCAEPLQRSHGRARPAYEEETAYNVILMSHPQATSLLIEDCTISHWMVGVKCNEGRVDLTCWDSVFEDNLKNIMTSEASIFGANCVFNALVVDGDGANFDSSPGTDLDLVECTFARGQSVWMHYECCQQNSMLRFRRCSFRDNAGPIETNKPSDIHEPIISVPTTIEDCLFESSGRSILVRSGFPVHIRRCIFAGFSSSFISQSAVAEVGQNRTVTIEQCQFKCNNSEAAIMITLDTTEPWQIRNCNFEFPEENFKKAPAIRTGKNEGKLPKVNLVIEDCNFIYLPPVDPARRIQHCLFSVRQVGNLALNRVVMESEYYGIYVDIPCEIFNEANENEWPLEINASHCTSTSKMTFVRSRNKALYDSNKAKLVIEKHNPTNPNVNYEKNEC